MSNSLQPHTSLEVTTRAKIIVTFTGETTLEAETSLTETRDRDSRTLTLKCFTLEKLPSQFRMPTSPYMPVTRFSGTVCYICGYPNHRSSQC